MKKAFILFTLILGSLFTAACSDFDLTAVATEIAPGNTSASYASPFVRVSEFNSFFVKFNLTGEGTPHFTAWFEPTDGSGQLETQELELECGNSKCSGFAISSPARAYKFQLELSGEAATRADNFEIETKSISVHSPWQLIPVASAQITDLPIISREEWGANSDYLLKRDIKTTVRTGGQRKQQCDEWVRDFPEEFQTDGRKITVDAENRELQFPRTYSKAIRKIVIHSTATDKDKDVNGDKKFTPEDAEAITRAIYYYHAMWKGWGDIGYHYLIDSFGNVYEGRSGGDYIVGAHAYCANTGTIGVAFIGDFGEALPSRSALVSAEQLLGELANLYSLDLAVSSSWHGKLIRNLVGHRDFVPTDCPGNELYAYLGDLAQGAMNYARGNLLSNADFDYRMIASDSPTFLDPLDEKTLAFKLKNVGKKAWPVDSKLRLSRSEIRKNRFGATVGDGSEFAVSLNSQVSAGATATVRIPVAAKMKAGRYRFGITPSFGGQDLRKFYVVVNISAAQLNYELLSAKHPPQPFVPGAQAISFVELRNESNFTWKAKGENRVYLGTTKPLNRASPFRPGTTHELGGLDQDVPPGGIAQFTLELTAPDRAARYKITFAPVVAGFGYLPDYDMQFHTTVREPRFSADLLGKSSGQDLRFEPGETRELSLSFLNTSQVDWSANQFDLELLQNSGVALDRNSLRLPQVVKENEQIRIAFNVTAPVRQGKYRFALRPKWENGKVKTLKPVDFLIEVNPPRLTGKLSPKPETLTLANGSEEMLSLAYKNTGNVTWQQSDVILQRLPARESALAAPDWLSPLQPAKLKENSVAPGEIGHFEFTVRKNSESSREVESFVPIVRGLGRIRGPAAKIEVQNANLIIAQANNLKSSVTISGNPAFAKAPSYAEASAGKPAGKSKGPLIRIKLSFESDRIDIGGGTFNIEQFGQTLFTGTFADFQVSKMEDDEYFRVYPVSDTILEIPNWYNHPGWTSEISDNRFRGILEIRRSGDKLIVINELPLEDYLRGIAEPLPTDPDEKVLLLAVLARSYALFYTDPAHRKFPGQPYDGSDNPNEFQRYLGYNYELRGNMPEATERTQGVAVTYKGNVVKTPYFTSSGGRTKTAAEVGWDATPFQFVKSVPDPWSCGLNLNAIGTELNCPQNAAGHGVGVSGKGAAGLAREGKTYQEILDYFFEGVEVEKVY